MELKLNKHKNYATGSGRMKRGRRESPQAQRWASFSSCFADSSGDREARNSVDFWNPFSTHRKSPPAVYCVNEYRRSSRPTMTLECEIVANGMRTVEPGGNSMTRPHSQRIRWPPFLGSKSPNAVTAHMPKGRLEKSVCLKQTVRGPKLYVVAANTLVGKIRLSDGLCVCKVSRVFA